MKLFALHVYVVVLIFLYGRTDAQIKGWTGDVTGAGADVEVTAPAKAETATGTLFTVTATPSVDNAPVGYAFAATDGNPESIAATTITNGAVVLSDGKTLDFETATTHVFKIVATENSDTDKTGTATVTLSISDVAEFAATSLTACMANQSPSGTTVGTYTISEANTAPTQTPEYSVKGTGADSFSIDSGTGVLTTKEAASKSSYSVDIEATNTVTGKGKVVLTVSVPCSAAEQLPSILAVTVMAVAAVWLV